MTPMSEYLEARERLRNEVLEADRRVMAVDVGDLLLILAGPPVSREDLVNLIEGFGAVEGPDWNWDMSPKSAEGLPALADAIQALYQGAPK